MAGAPLHEMPSEAARGTARGAADPVRVTEGADGLSMVADPATTVAVVATKPTDPVQWRLLSRQRSPTHQLAPRMPMPTSLPWVSMSMTVM